MGVLGLCTELVLPPEIALGLCTVLVLPPEIALGLCTVLVLPPEVNTVQLVAGCGVQAPVNGVAETWRTTTAAFADACRITGPTSCF